MKNKLMIIAALSAAFLYGCSSDSGTSAGGRKLYSLEAGTHSCKIGNTEALSDTVKSRIASRTCNFAGLYTAIIKKCQPTEVTFKLSGVTMDDILREMDKEGASMVHSATMKDAMNKCDDLFAMTQEMYLYIEVENDGKGFK